MPKDNLPEGLSPAKKQCMSELEQSVTLTGKTDLVNTDCSDSVQASMNKKLAEAVLSNFVVLRNIFSTLSNRDLESCCNVSQYWRSVADPMVIIHYDIQFGKEGMGDYGDENDDPWVQDHVVIKERVRYNQKSFKEYESNFEGVTKTLEEVLQSQKISIGLVIYGHVDPTLENVKAFMSKFGSLVVSLGFADEALMTTNKFCKLILQYFPNLEKLNCSMIRLTEDSGEDQNFNPNLPENKLQHLKRMYFHAGVEFTYQPFVTLLKIVPNLSEIRNFPIQLVKSLVISQRAGTLKSLSYPLEEPWFLEANDETLVTAFEKLAQLRPNLTSFCFLPTDFWPTEFLPRIKPHIFSILQSSSESLQTLALFPSESYGFQNIPELKGLKSVEFCVNRVDEEKFFPANISLEETFPNVSTVSICMSLSENVMNNYFPESLFSPWGSQVDKLKIRSVSLECVVLIHTLFPSIKELIVTATTKDLETLLPAISHFWPGLQSLTIDVDYSYSARRSSPQRTLDSVFTGIPEETVTKLKDSSANKDFTAEELKGFRAGSVIRKLSNLTLLKLVLRRRFLSDEYKERLPTLSQVSSDFGFQLIPGLKVVVGIWKNHKFVEEIKTSLLPLVNNIIDVDGYYYDDD